MDSQEIASIFQKDNFVEEAVYQDCKYLQVMDTNNGNYAEGKINFNLESVKGEFSVLSESFLVLPIRLSGATEFSTYAVKSSVVSFISGLSVTSGSGTTIVNEQNFATPLINALRMMVDSSIDFMEANEIGWFSHDKAIQPDVSLRNLSIVGGVQASVTAAVPTIDALRNQPLTNRISVFNTRSVSTIDGAGPAYTRDFVCYIPLKFLHSIFQVLDWPMVNFPLQISFAVSGFGGQSGYFPITCPTYGAHNTMGSTSAPAVTVLANTLTALQAAAAKPVISVYSGAVEKGYSPGVRLYLKAVKLPVETAIELRAQMAAGYKKVLNFTTTQFFTYAQAAAAVGSYSLTQQIASNVIKPNRIWVLPAFAGSLASQTNTFPMTVSHVGQYLTNTNIQINNTNYYNMNLRSQYEMYKLLKDEMVGGAYDQVHGAPISYTDFLNGVNPYVFNVSRSPTVKSNTMCTLSLSTDIAVPSGNVPALDLIILVESIETLILDISSNGVSCLTKKGSE